MKNIYTLANIKKIKWGELEENYPISLFPIMYPGWCYIIRRTGQIIGRYQKSIITLQTKKSGIIFVDHNEWNKLGSR